MNDVLGAKKMSRFIRNSGVMKLQEWGGGGRGVVLRISSDGDD